MKIKELREMETKKLRTELAGLRTKERELRFAIAGNQEKNVRSMRSVRRTIARMATILQEREKQEA